jgi:hypothetical protein
MGGAALGDCPAALPSSGSACLIIGECFYEDCAGSGRSAATCSNGAWAVQTAACAATHCIGAGSSPSCAPGQICSISEGGTLVSMCNESTCGTGPVTCACAGALCTNCSITGSVTQGVTVTCNSCPQGGCP